MNAQLLPLTPPVEPTPAMSRTPFRKPTGHVMSTFDERLLIGSALCAQAYSVSFLSLRVRSHTLKSPPCFMTRWISENAFGRSSSFMYMKQKNAVTSSKVESRNLRSRVRP